MSTETPQPDAAPAAKPAKPVKLRKDGQPDPRANNPGKPNYPYFIKGVKRPPTSPRNFPRYGDDVKQAILDGIAEGKSLCEVLGEPGMPCAWSFRNWRETDEAYEAAYQRALLYRAEMMVEKIIQAGNGAKDVTTAKAALAKLNCFAKAAGWANPAKYGNKSQHEITGAGGGTVVVTHKFDDARFSHLYLSRTGRSLPGPDAASADCN